MLWNDNVGRMPYKIDVGANLSGFGVQGRQPETLQTKAARAQAVEELLADLTVKDFDYHGPVDYFSGRSQILLSSLRYPNTSDTGAVTLFAKIRGDSGRRIALCLFGSASNVCNCQSAVPQWRKFGWTSSTNEGVELLLKCAPKAEQSEDSKRFWDDVAFEIGASEEDICWNALNVCYGQGAYHGNDCRPWHRGYTIGHYKDAEWLARIYFAHEDPSLFDDDEHFDVVYVGAAFWVRSGSPQSWVPYNTRTIPKLDASERPALVRPFVQLRSKLSGQHLAHLRHSAEYPERYGCK